MADQSLFGLSPEDAQRALVQQQQAQGMQYALNMGPQGNPFYLPGTAANAYSAGAGLGNVGGQLFGAIPPQVAEAYKVQKVMEETDSAGIDFDKDPVGYMKIASSNFLKAGMHDKALQVMNQANAFREQEVGNEYKGAMSEQARAIATEKMELLDEKQKDMEARTALTNAKTVKERAEVEIAQLEEARTAAREPKEIELIDAKIYNLRRTADAANQAAIKATGRMSRESVNQMFARMIQERLARGEITEAEAFELVKAGSVDPIRLMMGMMGSGSAPPAPPTKKFETPRPQESQPTPVEKPYKAEPGKGPYKPQPGYDYKKAAEKAFGSYEPEKYEYRVNPDTGKLQRRIK